jgi:hypothetical protein
VLRQMLNYDPYGTPWGYFGYDGLGLTRQLTNSISEYQQLTRDKTLKSRMTGLSTNVKVHMDADRRFQFKNSALVPQHFFNCT